MDSYSQPKNDVVKLINFDLLPEESSEGYSLKIRSLKILLQPTEIRCWGPYSVVVGSEFLRAVGPLFFDFTSKSIERYHSRSKTKSIREGLARWHLVRFDSTH